MRSGKLRHRVSFESLIETQDSDGALVEAWIDHFGQKFWAEVVYLSGKEFTEAQSIHSKVIARIKLRHREDFSPKMRIRYRDQIFNIDAILPDPKSGREYVNIMVYSGMNEG